MQSELIWLAGFVIVAGAVEYAIIMLLDLDWVLSVKVQGFIGLLVIGYLIRMSARLFQGKAMNGKMKYKDGKGGNGGS